MTFLILSITIILGIVTIIVDKKSLYSRWLAILMFLASLASFANELEDIIAPYIISNDNLGFLHTFPYEMTNAFITSFSEHMIAYSFFMYALAVSNLFKPKTQAYIGLPIFLFVIGMLFTSPFITNREKIAEGIFQIYYIKLSAWSIPLVLSGLFIILRSSLTEINIRIRNNKIINLLIISPIVLSAIINLYILRVMGIRSAWKNNVWVIGLVFLFFLVAASRFGALGIRLKFEKQILINTLEKILTNTSIFNHTLKNEIIKISISSNNIDYTLNNVEPDLDFIKENLETISSCSDYLLKMTNRIQDLAGDIDLSESIVNLVDLIDGALKHVKIFLTEKTISIISNYQYDIKIKCDALIMKEILSNILENACEASESSGIIEVNTSGTQNGIIIQIKDKGCGIKKEYVTKVIDPFFTTKRTKSNFGLGLSYCYKMLAKHKCELYISSEENKGTTVTITVPAFRIVKFDSHMPTRG